MEFGGETEEAENEGESGSRSVLKMLDPKLPSKAEREEHELIHLPYIGANIARKGEERKHRTRSRVRRRRT